MTTKCEVSDSPPTLSAQVLLLEEGHEWQEKSLVSQNRKKKTSPFLFYLKVTLLILLKNDLGKSTKGGARTLRPVSRGGEPPT